MVLEPNFAERGADAADVPRHPVADAQEVRGLLLRRRRGEVLGEYLGRIKRLGVYRAVPPGGGLEVAARFGAVVAPELARRKHRLVRKQLRFHHLALPVADAHREEVRRSERVEVERRVERHRRVLHGRDDCVGDKAPDFDGREIHDEFLRRGVARGGRDPVRVEYVRLLLPREHDLSVPVRDGRRNELDVLPRRIVRELELSGVFLSVVGEDLLHYGVRGDPREAVRQVVGERARDDALVRVREAVLREGGLRALRLLDALDLLAKLQIFLRRELDRADREPAREDKRVAVAGEGARERVAAVDRLVRRKRHRLAYRSAEVDLEALFGGGGGGKLQRILPLLERGASLEKPVRRAERGGERRDGHLVARLALQDRLRELDEDLRLQLGRGVLQVLRAYLAAQKLRTGRDARRDLLEEVAPLFRLQRKEMAAVGVVVESAEGERILDEERSVLREASLSGHHNGVLLGRDDGRGAQHIALRRRHEVRAVAQVRRQKVAARLVRRVHEHIFSVHLRGGDGVVEERRRHLFVHLRAASADEDGVRLESGDPEHRDEKRGLVAADSVAVVEGERHVVRRVAWRGVLHREAHVANLLRHELVDRLDEVEAGGLSVAVRGADDLHDFVGHRGVGLLEVGKR